jgi:hypothetical protein
LLSAVVLVSGLVVPFSAAAIDNPVTGGSGAGVGDFIKYSSDVAGSANCPAFDCTYADPAADLNTILAGTSAAPGGNIELFWSSETMDVGTFAAYIGVTSLTGELDGITITLSSLTWADWQISAYTCGANPLLWSVTPVPDGLFDQWFGDLEAAYSLSLTPAQRAGAMAAFVCHPQVGLQRFSDPNIAYVNDVNPTPGDWIIEPVIGLAGTFNACDFLPPEVSLPMGCASGPVQLSELVKFGMGGASEILYSFSATDSGQRNLMSPTSHTGNYELIPFAPPYDPPSGNKVGVMLSADVVLWRMRWVNPNNADLLVRVVDPLPPTATFVPGSLSCRLSDESIAPGICDFNVSVPNAVVFEGEIPGLANPLYNNEVIITFAFFEPGVLSHENIAFALWDEDGTGTINVEQEPVEAQGAVQAPPPPTDIPVVQPWGLAVLTLGMVIVAGWARRRRG